MADSVPTLDQLHSDPALAAGLSEPARLRLLAAAEGIAAVLRTAVVPPATAPSGEQSANDELLTPDEVAALLKKPRHSIYSMLRSKALAPCVLRINRRTLRVRKGELMRRLPHGA